MQITITTELDLTPKGKRVARYVRTNRGGTQLRWYVGGRLYVKGANPALTGEWVSGEGKPGHCPQPWADFA
jgi:hypothetical protein